MPHAQTYLQTHSLAQLKAEQGIKSSAKVGDYLFSLNYDQIESKAGPMVNQCRGLILALSDGRKVTQDQLLGAEHVGDTFVMARPFDRFFNLGDGNASEVNMNDPETVFFEKLDGTLCILYWDSIDSSWQVATRAVPRADKNMTGWEDMTFRTLFQKGLYDTLVEDGQFKSRALGLATLAVFEMWTSQLDKSCTYMFELTTPLNRIVVNYPHYRIHLLGMRETATGQEHDVTKLGFLGANKLLGVPVCPSHKLNNLDELLTFVGSKPPFEQEGIVVRDTHFNRVKVKSLAYMAYNRVRDASANSPRAIMELILTEKLDDVLPVLELHIQEKAKEMAEQVRKLFLEVDQDYQEILEEIKDQPDAQKRKFFALGVQERGAWMGPLMDRFLGKSKTLQEYLETRKNAEGAYPDGLLDTLISEANQA